MVWERLVWVRARLIVGVLAVLIGSGFASEVAACSVFGELLGVFEGNDSKDSILLDLGVEAVLLDRVDSPASSSGGLHLSTLTTKDGDEPICGGWNYVGLPEVDLIVVKAGNRYAAYGYDGAITGATPSSGLWNTSQLDNRELSHLTAYRVVPEPATAALLGIGTVLLCLTRRFERIARGGFQVLQGARMPRGHEGGEAARDAICGRIEASAPRRGSTRSSRGAGVVDVRIEGPGRHS